MNKFLIIAFLSFVLNTVGYVAAAAQQAAFGTNNVTVELPYPMPFQVAIIGAGAGGSSAAYWLSLAKKRFGRDICITVFERSDYIGGRSTVVHPYDDPSLPHVELGASVFVEANRNMMRAAKEFNLTLMTNGDPENTMGIWDGEKFVLELGPSSGAGSWWNTARVILRYGLSTPFHAKALVSSMLKSYAALYTPMIRNWPTIAALADAIAAATPVRTTGLSYLVSKGAGGAYAREVVDAATRGNYAQSIDAIHGFGALASLSAEGASRVREGNRRVFEEFLKVSGAEVKLRTTVTRVQTAVPLRRLRVFFSGDGLGAYMDADAVILAAPLNASGIVFAGVPGVPTGQGDAPLYVHLHTTLLTTTAQYPSAEYFYGPGTDNTPPRVVLTTSEGQRKGRKGAEFNSLAYLDVKVLRDEEKGESVVKIFSNGGVSDEWLEDMFGEGNIGWVYRKEWDAYPYLPPTAYFSPIKFDDRLYYVNAMETLISTMETETVAARNIVDLLLTEVFGSGICGAVYDDAREESEWDKSKVYGWDC